MKYFTIAVFSVFMLSSCSHSHKTMAMKDHLYNLYQKWDLTTLNGDSLSGEDQHPVFIQFQEKENQVMGSGGCNRFFGSFTVSGNNLKFSPLGSTRMACDEATNKIENAFFTALQSVTGYQFNGNNLALTVNGKTIATFTQSPTVPADLIGKWELFYITGPRIVFDALFPERKPFITFTKDNIHFNSYTGCNTMNGSYNGRQGEKLFNAGPMTMMACPGQGEQTYLKFFNAVDSYKVTGDTLTLYQKEVPVLKFRKDH